jgi:hypothetical protein
MPAQSPEYLKAPVRIGVVQLVSGTYGLHIKLDEGMQVAPGDVLEVTRADELVGELTVSKLIGADSTYLYGGAACEKGKGVVRKGDLVRKARK